MKKITDFQSLKEINKFRVEMGMRPITLGYRNCLNCNKKFSSQDILNIRICYSCKNKSY